MTQGKRFEVLGAAVGISVSESDEISTSLYFVYIFIYFFFLFPFYLPWNHEKGRNGKKSKSLFQSWRELPAEKCVYSTLKI